MAEREGFTPVPDSLLEAVIQFRMPGRHKDVVLALIRLTYGHQQDSRCIGASLVAKVTGLDVRSARRKLSDLEAWGVILREQRSEGMRPLVSIVTDSDTWAIGSASRPGVKASRDTSHPGIPVPRESGYGGPGIQGARPPGYLYPGSRDTGGPPLETILRDNQLETKSEQGSLVCITEPDPKPKPRERRTSTAFPVEPNALSKLSADLTLWWLEHPEFGRPNGAHAIEIVRNWSEGKDARRVDWLAVCRNAVAKGWARPEGAAPSKSDTISNHAREIFEESRERAG